MVLESRLRAGRVRGELPAARLSRAGVVRGEGGDRDVRPALGLEGVGELRREVLITAENGKSPAGARAEVSYAAEFTEYFSVDC